MLRGCARGSGHTKLGATSLICELMSAMERPVKDMFGPSLVRRPVHVRFAWAWLSREP